MTDKPNDIAAVLDEFGRNLATVARHAWKQLQPTLNATRDAFALVPDSDDEQPPPVEFPPYVAREALDACLAGDDAKAARLLSGLTDAQLYAIEGAGSALAIHASRLRKDPDEQPAHDDCAACGTGTTDSHGDHCPPFDPVAHWRARAEDAERRLDVVTRERDRVRGRAEVLERRAEAWETDAKRYAENADYWRERAKALGEHKARILDALGMDPLRDWDDIVNAARGVRADRDAQQGRAEAAERRTRILLDAATLAANRLEQAAAGNTLLTGLAEELRTLAAMTAPAEAEPGDGPE